LWLVAANPETDLRLPTYETPLRDHVTLGLLNERPRYSVHEPLPLRLIATNQSATPVRGYFLLSPATWRSEVYYRLNRSRFTRLGYLNEDADTVEPFRTLRVTEEVAIEFVLAFDPARNQFVLDSPGSYEFKVLYRDAPEQPNAVLESNIVSLDVVDISGSNQQALASYSKELALIAQQDPRRWPTTADTVKKALAFIEEFPDSPYTEHLRRGVRQTLEFRVVTNQATGEERWLLNQLRRERKEHP
jgi:hypothetical protein